MTPSILTPGVFAGYPDLVAGFTTRAFAAADTPLGDLRQRLADETGLAVASVGQVHGADVAIVREPGHTPAHDGLVTDRPGLLLTTVAADCALVLLADPVAGVVGACHSGWRGTVAGVVGRTVEAMVSLGARPERMRAYVAPCISVEAFEVGEEVAAAFPEASVVRREAWARPHVDLRVDLRRQLAEAGLGAEAVEVAGGCTVLDRERYHSYRAESGAAGRMAGFIGRRA